MALLTASASPADILLASGRLHGSYPETAFEEVIEVYRRGIETINVQIGQVEPPELTKASGVSKLSSVH